MSSSWKDCPLQDSSLTVRLRQYKDAGILSEKDTYHPGLGKGKCLMHKGTKVAVATRVTGVPKFTHTFGSNFAFSEPHDVAYNPQTGEMICFGKSYIKWS